LIVLPRGILNLPVPPVDVLLVILTIIVIIVFVSDLPPRLAVVKYAAVLMWVATLILYLIALVRSGGRHMFPKGWRSMSTTRRKRVGVALPRRDLMEAVKALDKRIANPVARIKRRPD
jgi:hypothetical protein